MREGLSKRIHPGFIFVWLFGMAFLNINCQDKGQKEKMYAHRLGDLSDVILIQSSACLGQVKAYAAVWEYAKVTGGDFDTAAGHILGSQRTDTVNRFAQNKMIIADFLENIKNPPETYRSVHEKFLDMVDMYKRLNDLAVKPTGPQEEYEASVYKLYDSILKTAGELKTLLGR